MANTVTTQVIQDGQRNVVVMIHVASDGAAGELTNTVVVDASTFDPPFTSEHLLSCRANLVGFSAQLKWDATTPVHLLALPDGDSVMDVRNFGGIPNEAGTGRTGDVTISTTGFTAAGDIGTIVLEFTKD